MNTPLVTFLKATFGQSHLSSKVSWEINCWCFCVVKKWLTKELTQHFWKDKKKCRFWGSKEFNTLKSKMTHSEKSSESFLICNLLGNTFNHGLNYFLIQTYFSCIIKNNLWFEYIFRELLLTAQGIHLVFKNRNKNDPSVVHTFFFPQEMWWNQASEHFLMLIEQAWKNLSYKSNCSGGKCMLFLNHRVGQWVWLCTWLNGECID